jgi:DNA-binding PadR family transcriptional regulator
MRHHWYDHHNDEFSAGARGRRGRMRGPFGGGGGGWAAGFGGPGGPGWLGQMFGRGPRRRRGNVRFAILTLLGEQPHNGYPIIQAIEQRSHGTWKPSSGSIYPTLQQLEDEGLVTAPDSATGQSRTYELTKAGRAYVKEHADELETDWDLDDDDNPWADNPRVELFMVFRQVAQAALQVAQAGGDKEIAQAKQLLGDVRRKLYGILAELGEDD